MPRVAKGDPVIRRDNGRLGSVEGDSVVPGYVNVRFFDTWKVHPILIGELKLLQVEVVTQRAG
jgi:hypothetical protein